MSMKSTKINNAEIILPTLDIIDKKWKGKKILDLQYWVMAILSKRRSGKSTLIYNLIKQFANKNTIILFFCPTFHKDSTYGAIKKYLDEREINYEIFSHFIEDGCNHIDEFLDANNKPAQKDRKSVV
jgi:predicted AAA+ superfamily ATPase